MDERKITDLSLKDIHVNMTRGSFELVGYNELKYKISLIADYLENVEVTEENIKENKKLVARVRKAIDELNRDRIEFKKTYLLPYEYYAQQVKEVSDMAKEAEETVRQQIRELEEIERDEKEARIKELFEARLRPYPHKEIMDFEEFMKPSYANKTYSMSKVEEEIVKFLESRERDYEALEDIASTTKAPLEDLVMEYKDMPEPSVAGVINNRRKHDERKKQVSEKLSKNVSEPVEWTLRFKSLSNYYRAYNILKEAEIEVIPDPNVTP